MLFRSYLNAVKLVITVYLERISVHRAREIRKKK